jgi:hypothetical protein
MFDIIPQDQIIYLDDVWENLQKEEDIQESTSKNKGKNKKAKPKPEPEPKEGESLLLSIEQLEILTGFGLSKLEAAEAFVENNNNLDRTIDHIILNKLNYNGRREANSLQKVYHRRDIRDRR